MDIKTNKDFQEVADRIDCADEEYRKIPSQINDMFYEKKLLTCEAKIILGLCNDILNVNSTVNKTRNGCEFVPRTSTRPGSYIQ